MLSILGKIREFILKQFKQLKVIKFNNINFLLIRAVSGEIIHNLQIGLIKELYNTYIIQNVKFPVK